MMKTPPPKKLAFLLYESKSPPRYFEINKNLLRFILIGLPIVALFSLAIMLLSLVYLKELTLSTSTHDPKIVKQLKADNKQLRDQIDVLKKDGYLLQNKLANSASDSPTSLFPLFKSPNQNKKVTDSKLMQVDNINSVISDKHVVFNFDLVNTTSNNQRLTGYCFVTMRMANTLTFYPGRNLHPLNGSIPYNNGESFATARFRPFNIKFDLAVPLEFPLVFTIYIFSITGDLLYSTEYSYSGDNGPAPTPVPTPTPAPTATATPSPTPTAQPKETIEPPPQDIEENMDMMGEELEEVEQ